MTEKPEATTTVELTNDELDVVLRYLEDLPALMRLEGAEKQAYEKLRAAWEKAGERDT